VTLRCNKSCATLRPIGSGAENKVREVGMSAVASITPPTAALKSLYELGEIPPLGHVPERMYAWAIRKDRHGPPENSMQIEVIPTWPIADDEVLVFVIAGGVNYNGIWAALGQPISPLDVHKNPFHIAGSDASGVVWAVGAKVRRWKIGDEVIVHCNQDDGDDEDCNGGDPLLSPSQRIWGYETPDGSFAQFCRVQSRQLMPKPQHLTWEEAACYTLTLATAYRMLFGHPPHTLKPGDNVLVWGASGGLGVFGVQLAAASGANAIGVVSDATKRDYVMQLGAKGVINRKEFNCWGAMPTVNSPAYDAWVKEARKFGKAIWEITGKRDVDIVFEHPGEQTFPVSSLVVKRGGMVVFCAGTTGFNISFDARYVWMRQKRIQGSHFAHLKQASAANQFVLDRRIDPCMSEVFPWKEVPHAHMKMWKNQHRPGNMAVLINAPHPGLRNFDDLIETGRRP
jgi:crotonyl-CoA carboxylase/reductase